MDISSYRPIRINILLITFLFCYFLVPGFLSAQNVDSKKQLLPVCVAFYNVENLFDTIHQSGDADFEFTPQGDNVWNTPKYLEKLDRLAEVISKVATDITPDGPAVLGLSEIENAQVLEDLVKHEKIKDRDYQVVFIRGRDRRVNNALLYNPRYLTVTNTVSMPVVAEDIPDLRTRDHLVVSGLLLNEPMHFIVAHWPSRSGGERRSRPRRIAAAIDGRFAIDSLKALNEEAKIIFMGDLNDDPTDESVLEYLNTGNDINELSEGQLYNPYVNLAKKGIGSLAYRDAWNLFDQLILTQSFLGNDHSNFTFYQADVFNKPFLRQSTGRFQGYPYRSFGGGVYLGGYSDHFPVYVILIREVK
jgi:endonuclease/exonuclease/phosphatase family metal-dependent hydrolase